MSTVHTKTSSRGFSTLEILIAMTVLLLTISAVVMLFPGIQSGSVDAEMSAEALGVAQGALENEQSLARKDFKLVVATTSIETVAGTPYTKNVVVQTTDYFTKRVVVNVTWGAMYSRGQQTSLSTIVTDFQNVVGGDTCDSTFPGSWTFPVTAFNGLFGAISGLGDASGLYPLTDIDVFRKRLYATVSASSPTTLGPNNPGSAVNDTSTGTIAWSSPANTLVSDSVYSAATLSTGQTTNYVKVSNLGFAVPNGATIVGIQVDVKRKGSSSTNTVRDSAVKIVRSDGTLGSLNKADLSTNWPTSEAYKSYGNSSDLWNETGLSAAAVNSPNFGVAISAVGSAGSNSRTASIDHVRVTVYYTKQFYVVNVNNPASPVFVSGLGQNSVSTGMNAVAVATSTTAGAYAYVAMNSATTQFEVIDLSPTTPTVVSAYAIPSATAVANTVFYKDGYAYVGLANNTGGAEFYVLDVHIPSSIPAPLGSFEVGSGIHSIYVKNNYAYLSTDDSNRELIVLNLQDLVHPALYGIYNVPGASGSGQGRTLYTTGDTLYFGTYYNLTASPEFSIIDTSTAVPTLKGSYDIGPNSSNPFGVYGLVANNKLAFVLTSSPSNGGKIQILNVGTPASVSAGSSVNLPNTGGGVGLDCEWNPSNGKDYFFAASVPTSGTNTNKGSLTVITN